MTVVNEEAENIVQEAVESGAIDVTDSSPVAPPPDAVDAGAPPEATSQTDDAPGEPQDAVSDPQDAESDTASADIDATNEETPECIEDPGDEGPISESADTDGQAKTAETAEPAEATDPTDSADGADADEAAEASIDETESLEKALDNASADLADVAALAAAGLEDEIEDLTTEDVALEMPTETVESEAAVESTAPVADDSADPMMEETSDACQAASPEAAARAVAEIETGIRRLGELLATQVHEQWGHARQALEEANSLKAKLEGSTDTAEAMLLDVQRIKDEALIARDEAVLASRKAKLAREDARRCQARAGKSADAAETAADLALQEVRNLSTIADG